MSRKVKVVPVENVEQVEVPESEPVAGDAPPQELLSPSDKAPEAEIPAPEVVGMNSLEIENTSSDKAEVEEVKETKAKKKDDKITCPVCNKTMLSKTFKYKHQALCKPKEPTPSLAPKTPKPKKEAKAKNKEIPVVSFHDFKEMKEVMPAPPPDYATQYRAARDQRLQVRQQRIRSLISQAI